MATNYQLFFEPKERLRLTLENDRSYLDVRPAWAAPISQPGRFLALLDKKGEEIALIPDPKALSAASRAVLERALRVRYLTATVQQVLEARQEYGATYWSVDTDRGPRDFVTQNLQENAVWFSDNHLLLLDVDGNRFELPDISVLDAQSQTLLRAIV